MASTVTARWRYVYTKFTQQIIFALFHVIATFDPKPDWLICGTAIRATM